MKDIILISGHKGFIGSNIINELKKNFKFIKLSKVKKFEKVNSNYSYFKNIKIKKNQIKSLIYCSYYTPNSRYSDSEQLRLNNIVTKNILYLIKKYKVRTCIFLSSMAVYNTTKSKAISEKTEVTKQTVYARSKLRDERRLYGLYKNKHLESLTILRLPGVIGKNSKNNFISNMAKAIITSKKFKVRNPEFKFNNVIHIKTLVNFIKLILFSSKKKFNIFNLGALKPLKVKKIVRLLILKLNSNYNQISFEQKKDNGFKINFNNAKKYGYIAGAVEMELNSYIKDIKFK